MKRILLLIATIAVLTEAILVVANQQGWKKCFYTEHSPDKTLQARLGFFKREKEQCKAHFTVRIVHEGSTLQEIYSKEHYCQQAKPNNSYVLKHTSQQSVGQGMYEICVEMIYNNNPNAVIQMFMGQRLNPIIYEHSDAAVPLIEARELIELDLTVQSIKRSLVNSNSHNKSIRENGEWLDFKIVELMDFNQMSNIMQTITLVVFAFVWIRIVRRLKKDK